MTRASEPGRKTPAPLSEVVLRFWWPVYSECRNRGCSEDESRHLMGVILGRAADSTVFFRNEDFGGSLRQVVRNEMKRVLDDPDRFRHSPVQLNSPALDAQSREEFRPGPEKDGFTTRWAILILEQALEAVRGEYRELGKRELFARIEPHLARRASAYAPGDDKDSPDAQEIASARSRFREWVRRLTGETVTTPMALEAELIELFGNS